MQQWVENVLRHDKIEHVGAANRHFDQRLAILDQLKVRDSSLKALLPVLEHPDPNVRYTAALQYRSIDPELYTATLRVLESQGGVVGREAARMLAAPPLTLQRNVSVRQVSMPPNWQVSNPPPVKMTLDQLEQELRKILPDQSEQVMALAQPAIGLWTQLPREERPDNASRFGGWPKAPPDFVWPMRGGEPLQFLGQINCKDFKGLAGSEQLPDRGLLALFGDFDTINGCLMTGLGGSLFHWKEIDELISVKPPLEPHQIGLVCDLMLYSMIDLPHPESSVIRRLLRGDAIEVYKTFREAALGYGIPPSEGNRCSRSKILGWPDLVQSDDLDEWLDGRKQSFRLLIQIESYGDGRSYQDWGPGGTLYFMIGADDFVRGNWESAQLTGQFT